ncbi:MAG: type II toxin-antitoxin system prevent-host-death family antitoxin [Anaerolineae bacterium]|nr:type II toxin-antitoxin system prevent-host-death family antitoxin [Anaerolineae bacterium]
MSETLVGVRDFKIHLGHYLRRVEAGESLVITSRGRAIGRLIPARSNIDENTIDARVADLVASGLVEWNGERFQPEEPALEGPKGFSLSDWVIAERESAVERLL